MLVFTRKRNQRVTVEIGGILATVTVVEVRGDKVRLGFTGPDEVIFHRQEVYDAINQSNETSHESKDCLKDGEKTNGAVDLNQSKETANERESKTA